jgi:peroxiredoxin (alkyl hydroperoxide reductase subunit C)
MVTIAPPPPASGVLSHGLTPGVRAPDLDVPTAPDGHHTQLSSFRGAPLVLIFYPGDFTPVCTGELGLFNELLPELDRFGAKVLGISCDSVWAHCAYSQDLNLKIPLLSDFHPKGELSRRYAVYRDDIGTSERALYVIDPEGVIFWSEVSPIELNPGADGVLDSLERLTGRELSSASALPSPPRSQEEVRR